MKRIVLLSLAVLPLFQASAQLQVYYAGDPGLVAPSHLTGPNVVLSNVFSQTIEPQQVGLFNDSTASIGLDSGLVISTGVVYGLVGPNNIPNMSLGGGYTTGDPDLTTMSTFYANVIGDPGILQMDLVPAGDTLEVRYVFGSEEYDEYVCSDKDDRVGMFLSGPGIVGPFSNSAINMALLPGSNLPVTVNTLNRGINGDNGNLGLCGLNPLWQMDTIYYINNDLGLGTQLDGYSVVLTARAVVMPGALYHLKLAIADAGDANYDSAIFLPDGAISCTELSTGLQDIGLASAQAVWLHDRTVNVRGLGAEGGPVYVEVFDPTGRLLQSSMATGNGALWSTELTGDLSGLVILRATQHGKVITGKVFVP
ncbi:MAG TPA: choice-of-anchor L domain-containing protein [Flavobacteriales bacterium]|nr:choice-of-anchor L domain-containing protein [Flavobacteriales bacterium]